MRKQASRVNTVILNSIPLNRKVKRYWISKYERIAENCGTEEACKKFKQLRVALLNYKADPQRKSNQDKYLSQCGFRTNGMLRALFESCDCQPQTIFNFLKLYTAPTKDRKELGLVREETQRRLQNVKANPSHPKYLDAWLAFLWESPRTSYNIAVSNKSHPFHDAATSHSYEYWKGYWFKWRNTLRNGWKSGQHLDSKQVFPEVYKDYRPADDASCSYETDFAELVAMHFPEYSYAFSGLGGLSDEDIEFVDRFLDDKVASELQKIRSSSDDGIIRNWIGDDPYRGLAVGQVQHLPKKGGGTDYRDIAVPNRFIQAALEPVADKLYHLLRKLPKDATFDQSRFDTVLVNRVTNGNLYQGSVDLSKATDNLPREWGIAIVESIIAHCDLSPEERLLRQIFGEKYLEDLLEEFAERSWTLFKHVSGANWIDDGYVDHWKVGQPLGSLPSFALLGITHNLYVEAMGCSLGLLHSPYVILGDDLVIFNAKLRKKYITEMTSRAIPLSLQKSYEGDLSEFAGKLYVKNCIPFHTSDHNPLTWQSLFDYQRSTGIGIPWKNLPGQLKRRYRKVIANECKKDGLPSKAVMQLVDSTYKLIRLCEVGALGSSQYPAIPDNWVNSGVIASFFEAIGKEDNLTPEAKPHSGITVLDGSPVKLLSDRYANKDGWFLRFRPVELPSWYKAKFRPCSTDKAILAAYAALRTTV
jgi:hypothetical protein